MFVARGDHDAHAAYPMSDPEHRHSSQCSMPLSDNDRSRLDDRVDVAALERLLGRMPAHSHSLLINSCLRDPDPDVAGVAAFLDDELQREWMAVWKSRERK